MSIEWKKGEPPERESGEWLVWSEDAGDRLAYRIGAAGRLRIHDKTNDEHEAAILETITHHHPHKITPPEEESPAPSPRKGAEGSEGGGKGASQWTPGPWDFDRETWYEYHPVEEEKQGPLIVFPADGVGVRDQTTIASLCEVEVGGETARANAHLIAAAPDLYEVLDELANDLDLNGGPQWPGSPMERKARAILAKARGEGS